MCLSVELPPTPGLLFSMSGPSEDDIVQRVIAVIGAGGRMDVGGLCGKIGLKKDVVMPAVKSHPESFEASKKWIHMSFARGPSNQRFRLWS